jgi:hypothetical protein
MHVCMYACMHVYICTALASDDFIVGVTSLKFGDTQDKAFELLKWKSPAQKNYGAPSIMDSGTYQNISRSSRVVCTVTFI